MNETPSPRAPKGLAPPLAVALEPVAVACKRWQGVDAVRNRGFSGAAVGGQGGAGHEQCAAWSRWVAGAARGRNPSKETTGAPAVGCGEQKRHAGRAPLSLTHL